MAGRSALATRQGIFELSRKLNCEVCCRASSDERDQH